MMGRTLCLSNGGMVAGPEPPRGPCDKVWRSGRGVRPRDKEVSPAISQEEEEEEEEEEGVGGLLRLRAKAT